MTLTLPAVPTSPLPIPLDGFVLAVNSEAAS